MKVNEFKKQLQDLVTHGLIADIFKMERSYMLLKNIGTNAHVINAPSAGNFGELFGSIQVALQTDIILAVTRLYDPPDKKYPTRCIRRLFSLRFAQGECGVKPELLVSLAPLRENKEFKTDKPLRGYGLTPHYI